MLQINVSNGESVLLYKQGINTCLPGTFLNSFLFNTRAANTLDRTVNSNIVHLK